MALRAHHDDYGTQIVASKVVGMLESCLPEDVLRLMWVSHLCVRDLCRGFRPGVLLH